MADEKYMVVVEYRVSGRINRHSVSEYTDRERFESAVADCYPDGNRRIGITDYTALFVEDVPRTPCENEDY